MDEENSIAQKKQRQLKLIIIVLGAIIAVLVVILKASQNSDNPKKASSTNNITNGAQQIDPRDVWIDTITTDRHLDQKRMDTIQESVDATLKQVIQNRVELEQKIAEVPKNIPSAVSQTKVVTPNANDFISSSNDQMEVPVYGEVAQRVATPGIQKIAINLVPIDALKKAGHTPLNTVDTVIPSGSFAKGVLIGGVDASTSINASSNPQPVLIRITNPGNLPRKFKSDLKGCRVLAATYGDLSSERVNMRLESMSCIERHTGEVIDIKVSGYVAGEDGRGGLRGTVVDLAGPVMRNAAIGGFLGGIGNFMSQARSPITFSPTNGLAQTNPLDTEAMLRQGAAQGAGNALNKYADFYIKRAEQLQPVIQVQAGRVVDIVFTSSVRLGGGKTRTAIALANDQNRYNTIKTMSKDVPVDAWLPNQHNQGSGS